LLFTELKVFSKGFGQRNSILAWLLKYLGNPLFDHLTISNDVPNFLNPFIVVSFVDADGQNENRSEKQRHLKVIQLTVFFCKDLFTGD
jgi:hypothetical protein